ncbi:MAG: hypothetical protein WAK55_12895, partial [Xanthobacteraceae bacterium]
LYRSSGDALDGAARPRLMCSVGPFGRSSMAKFVPLTLRGDQKLTIQVNLDEVRVLRPSPNGGTNVTFDDAHGVLVEEDSDRILRLGER